MTVETQDPNAWIRSNIVLMLAALCTVALSVIQMALPAGHLLPPYALALQYVAMGVMMLLHVIRHLGVRMAIAYFVSMVVVEFLCERLNIVTGGLLYGSLVYEDLLGPRIAGVPVGVPVAMAIITWPIFTLVNVILYRRMVVFNEGQGLFAILSTAMLCGFVQSSMGFTTEPMLQKLGAYSYPGVLAGVERNAYFGAPLMAQTGWMIVVAIMVLTLMLIVGPLFSRRRAVPLHGIFDSVPVVVFGVMIVTLSLNALELTHTMTTLWSGGVVALIGATALRIHRVEARRPGG